MKYNLTHTDCAGGVTVVDGFLEMVFVVLARLGLRLDDEWPRFWYEDDDGLEIENNLQSLSIWQMATVVQ